MLRKIDGQISVYEYQYNGCAPFDDVLRWCRENIRRRYWTNGHETIWISGKDAMMLFTLRWS